MAKANRADLIKRTHKVLKKHFTPVLPAADRSVLEHLLFAGCLEDASYEVAEEWLAKLQQLYFDWNEVRVTTARELMEALGGSPEAGATAQRVKSSLQSIFESMYSFDLEGFKKLKLGEAQAKLASFKGPSLFVQAYVTQAALGGHAIPVSRGGLRLLQLVSVCSPAEADTGSVPGLERAIPKNQGPEFASLLHSAGARLLADPKQPSMQAILVEIHPDAADRLPSARGKSSSKSARKGSTTKGRGSKKPAASKSASPAKAEKKKPVAKKKSATKKGTGKVSDKKPTSGTKDSGAKRSKSTSKQLSRRKPR